MIKRGEKETWDIQEATTPLISDPCVEVTMYIPVVIFFSA